MPPRQADPILLHIDDDGDTPRIRQDRRSAVKDLGEGFYWVRLRFGFSGTTHVPTRLKALDFDPPLPPDELTYFIGSDETMPRQKRPLRRWRKTVFIYLHRNAQPAVLYHGPPARRLVEIGTRIEL